MLWIKLYVAGFLPLCVLLALAASRWGGHTEKQVAWAFVIAALAQKSSLYWSRLNFKYLEPGVLIVDFGLFIVLMVLAIRDPKTWLLIATAFQLLSASAHLARMIDVGMSPLAYAILMGSGGYPILILLAAGILAKARQQRKMPARVTTG